RRQRRLQDQSLSSPSGESPLILARSTCDGLKTMTRRCKIGTSTPVFGFRPIRSDLERTKNRPKDDNLTGSPATKASANSSNTACTNSADSLRESPRRRYTASARSTRTTVRRALRCEALSTSSTIDTPPPEFRARSQIWSVLDRVNPIQPAALI